MFERVLVCLDGTRFGGQALDYAIEIAKRFSAEVVLIRVITAATPEHPISLSAEVSEIAKDTAHLKDKRNVETARRYLKTKLEQVTARGVKSSIHVVAGVPGKAIVQFCHQENVGLVVMMTHGKSGIKRAILGSTTDEVIRESGLPVLAISPRPD
ncbi:MAG: universal stress protein [Dehalococcoidales bacterium]|nr:universal stress protein [Dehalococcoidales bacterium]